MAISRSEIKTYLSDYFDEYRSKAIALMNARAKVGNLRSVRRIKRLPPDTQAALLIAGIKFDAPWGHEHLLRELIQQPLPFTSRQIGQLCGTLIEYATPFTRPDMVLVLNAIDRYRQKDSLTQTAVNRLRIASKRLNRSLGVIHDVTWTRPEPRLSTLKRRMERLVDESESEGN